jgi:hypothetical protein
VNDDPRTRAYARPMDSQDWCSRNLDLRERNQLLREESDALMARTRKLIEEAQQIRAPAEGGGPTAVGPAPRG